MPLNSDGSPKLTPALAKCMRLMAAGFGLFLSADGRGWMLTDMHTKVSGSVAQHMIRVGWAGDVTLGFYRLTAEGQRVLAAQPVDSPPAA